MSNPPYPCLGVPADGFCPQTPTYPARECTSGCSWWGSQYQGKPWPTGWGNAMNWPTAARAAGFTLSAIPRPNSIMCIPPNHNGAGPMGHVAFVTGPLSNGTVPVIEVNWKPPYDYDYRPAPVAGCEFIYLVPKPTPAPDPPAAKGIPDMWLYEAPNGTIYLVTGSTSIAFSFIADVNYFEGKGAPLVQSSGLTANAIAAIQTKLGI